MPQLVAFDFVRNRRAWADDAHVAAQDIEKLRQLVEARPSQDAPQPRYSLVRAQLVRRPLAVSLIRIGLAFNVLSLKLAVLAVIDTGVHRAKFVEEENAAIHAEPAASLNHYIEQRLTRHARIRDDHLVRSGFTDCLGQTLQITDHRHAFEVRWRSRVELPVLDQADHPIAKFRARSHLADALQRFRATPDNQRGNQIDAATPHHNLSSPQDHAHGAYAHQRQEEIKEEDATRIRESAIGNSSAIHKRSRHDQQGANRRGFKNERHVID